MQLIGKMLEKTIKASAILPLVPVLFTALLLSYYPVRDVDAFWHLRTGQLILEEGRLPTTNTFAGTFPDHPWPNPEWLFQVLLAGLHSLGGFGAITLFKVLMVMLIAAALYVAMLRSGGGALTAAAVTVIALSAMQFRFTERPHLFSYLLTVVALYIVQRHRREGGRAVWLLPPIFAFWGNVHPELLIAWLLVAAVLAGDWLDSRFGRREKGPSGTAMAATLLCLPAACLNPEGWHVIVFPFMHIVVGPVVEVTEYAFTSLSRVPLFYVFALVLAASFLARGRRSDLADVLPAAAVIVFGAVYQRATPYVYLVGAPILCRNIAAGAFSWLSPLRAGLVFTFFAAIALSWAVSADDLNTYRWGRGLDESDFPAAAADLLATGRLPGKLYNRYGMGGYLLWRLYPVMGVFQDGRLQAYPYEFISDFNARFDPDRWPELLAEHDVNTALVQRPGQTYLFSREGWGIVNWDDTWVLLVRRTAASEELLDELEYRAFVPGVDISAVREPELLQVMLDEMDRNQRERRSPSAVTANNQAVVLLRLGRRSEAARLFRRSGEMGYAPAWLNHAGLLLERGERDGAIRSLGAALEIDEGFAEARRVLERIGGGDGGDGR